MEIREDWALVEADFQSEYGLDLEVEMDRRSWRWFQVRVQGLLTAFNSQGSPRTRLGIRFAPAPRTDGGELGGG